MIQDSSAITWPPVYTIRKHRLAKSVKLRAMQDQGLHITVPVRFNLKNIPAILEENKPWILKHLSQIRLKKSDTLPANICLHTLNETWKVEYVECQSRLEMIIKPSHEIVFVGKPQENKIYRDKLTGWIKQYAMQVLSKELRALSQQTGMSFDALSIRDQKTRWGSCSSNKSISLSYKLIFLPPRLSRHVMIHELCHTLFLNHSEQFWSKVAEFDPAFRMHKRELRKVDQYIPEWV